MGRSKWSFVVLPQEYLHSPTICHDLVAQDLATWGKPPTVTMFYYIDDIMLISDSLADLNTAARSLQQALDSWGWAVDDCKVQRPGLSVKFLEAVWLGKTKVIPEAVIDKVQAYP